MSAAAVARPVIYFHVSTMQPIAAVIIACPAVADGTATLKLFYPDYFPAGQDDLPATGVPYSASPTGGCWTDPGF